MCAANQFIRFGYRRPPPWKVSKSMEILEAAVRSPRSNVLPKNVRDALDKGMSGWSTLPKELLRLESVYIPQSASVPSLAHGMEAVLRGDGVYPLEAPWAFPRHPALRHLFSDGLRRIVQPEFIAWDALPMFIPASEDDVLHHVASKLDDVSYCSSTSSVIPSLCALYHLVSNFRETGLFGGLSLHVRDMPATFSRAHRRPVAFTLARVPSSSSRPVYSVNAHTGEDRGPSILRDLGHSMERMFTTSPTEFAARYVIQHVSDQTPQKSSNHHSLSTYGTQTSADQQNQFYHYSRVSRILVRAQIDCKNRETGEVFDVKTRAVAPIRYDLSNYSAFTSHRLRFLQGRSDSYEREFYDMVRSVFLKYALQLRIGRMAGALVAYHNTSEVLGLEYLRLAEMESYVFGGHAWSNIAFSSCVRIFENILSMITDVLPPADDERTKVVLFTEWSQNRMYIFAQRISNAADDEFGSAKFVQRDVVEDKKTSSSDVDAFVGHAIWHLDSHFHGRKSGVALVGSHPRIQALGGERVDTLDSVPIRRNWNDGRPSTDYRNYNFSSLRPDTFRAWQLDVVPFINGEVASRNSSAFQEDDEFTLKYSLSEINNLKTEHLSKFVLGLGAVYLR